MIDLIVQVFESEISTSTELAVALAIARRCGGSGGQCFASQATIAANARVHPKTVARVLNEFEERGWIVRRRHRVSKTGVRRTDTIFLTLPPVTIKTPVPGAESHFDDQDTESQPPRPGLPGQGVSRGVGPRPGLHKESMKNPDEDSSTAGLASGDREDEDSDDVDLAVATDLIWQRVGDKGRERSSRADVRRALAAAIGRRGKDETPADRLQAIMRGIDGYLRSDEATRDGGAFERGAHRTIEKDRWEGFAAPADKPSPVGSHEAPSEQLQRMWMDLYTESGRWPSERGPRPGQPGCRVDARILADYLKPAAPAALDDDEGAFD